MSTILSADAVEKWWSPESGLRPVTFTLAAGEVVVVRGRSGSGKSTLLSLLAGWTQPDGGSLTWAPEIAAMADRWAGIAVVPQVLALVPELTVRENIESGVGPDAVHDVDAILDRLDLMDLHDRFPDETSLGQQQRTAVARAAVAAPLLLLADEPTSHQDPHHVRALLEVLQEVAANGSAVLVATHEPAVVDAASHRVDLLA